MPPTDSQMEVVEVLEPGILTTVQDRGRHGYQRYGVPSSGALDEFALRAANILVGNDDGAAALELTFSGARLRFLMPTMVAITGGDLGPELDGGAVAQWEAVPVAPGGVLAFGQVRAGMRAYLAVAGGIDVPPVLGSRSTYSRSRLGGVDGRPLQAGDVLRRGPLGEGLRGKRMPDSAIPERGRGHRLRVVLGPQDDAFTEEGVRTFLSSTYSVTNLSDRTGYRLEGPTIQHAGGADIISDGIPLGAVQVTGDGMPIVLLSDRGTTGGYTKIATVISTDVRKLAQATPGDTVTFASVTVEEAHQALREQERTLDEIRSLPYVEYAEHRYRARVGGLEHEAVTGLVEVDPRADSPARPVGRTVRVTVGGASYTFDVEVEAE